MPDSFSGSSFVDIIFLSVAVFSWGCWLPLKRSDLPLIVTRLLLKCPGALISQIESLHSSRGPENLCNVVHYFTMSCRSVFQASLSDIKIVLKNPISGLPWWHSG